jgi:hypothetical protein
MEVWMFDSRSSLRVAIVALLACVAAVACDESDLSDARTAQLRVGISRDSVLKILASAAEGGGGATASASGEMSNVWRSEQYLTGGYTVEILWYSPTGEKRSAADTIPSGKVYPITLIEGKVVGLGRAQYETVAGQKAIVVNRY